MAGQWRRPPLALAALLPTLGCGRPPSVAAFSPRCSMESHSNDNSGAGGPRGVGNKIDDAASARSMAAPFWRLAPNNYTDSYCRSAVVGFDGRRPRGDVKHA